MKIKCQFCDRIYNDPTASCPGCGAYNEAPEEEFFAPAPQPRPQPSAPPKRSYAVRIVSISVSLIFLLAFYVFRSNDFRTSSQSRDGSVATERASEEGIIELYKALEANPKDFGVVQKLTTLLYGAKRESEAREVSMYLLRGQCDDPSFYRGIAGAMQGSGDKGYAVRMYLCSYQISGEKADLELAAKSGSPADFMGTGPTSQSLEFLFRKPMSLITWEDVGQIKYISAHYDYIEISTEPYAEDEYSSRDAIQSFRVDNSSDDAFVYLYDLEQLEVYRSANLDEINLFALQGLRSLRLSNLSKSPDLNAIANLPLLESLHVGGSGITTLDGLDNLPGLRELSLEGTEIESLSMLASYRNIKSLLLRNNKKLTGLSSLEMMDHLEALHVERQDVLDFRFLEKMHSLSELALINTSVKDIYFLSQLETLEALTIRENSDLKSVSGIGELTGLKRLSVTASEFNMSGLDELASLNELEYLKLYNPTSLSMISGLSSIKTLELSSISLLRSISPIAGLVNLETFRVDSTSTNIGHFDYSMEALASLPNLTHVSIPGHSLYYSKPLFSIPTLEYLDLTGCRLEFSNLSGLKNVKTLKLGGTKWINGVQIWGSGGITNYGWNDVETDAALATAVGLEKLERLEINKTTLGDISFIGTLPNLEYADLADNYITDISPLSGSDSLREVNLSGNPVRDWSIAESWTHVYVVR